MSGREGIADETVWLACREPHKMLDWLRGSGRSDDRRCRLVVCACVRRVWDRLDERCRGAVGISERFAEGRATLGELDAAQVTTIAAWDDAEWPS